MLENAAESHTSGARFVGCGFTIRLIILENQVTPFQGSQLSNQEIFHNQLGAGMGVNLLCTLRFDNNIKELQKARLKQIMNFPDLLLQNISLFHQYLRQN